MSSTTSNLMIKALQGYGVKFKTAYLPASSTVARLNFLAGLMWLHAQAGTWGLYDQLLPPQLGLAASSGK
jgi:hypothetical protein